MSFGRRDRGPFHSSPPISYSCHLEEQGTKVQNPKTMLAVVDTISTTAYKLGEGENIQIQEAGQKKSTTSIRWP